MHVREGVEAMLARKARWHLHAQSWQRMACTPTPSTSSSSLLSAQAWHSTAITAVLEYSVSDRLGSFRAGTWCGVGLRVIVQHVCSASRNCCCHCRVTSEGAASGLTLHMLDLLHTGGHTSVLWLMCPSSWVLTPPLVGELAAVACPAVGGAETACRPRPEKQGCRNCKAHACKQLMLSHSMRFHHPERLKTTWTTFGVVSALLLTISFPIVVMPTDDMLVEAEVRRQMRQQESHSCCEARQG